MPDYAKIQCKDLSNHPRILKVKIQIFLSVIKDYFDIIYYLYEFI